MESYEFVKLDMFNNYSMFYKIIGSNPSLKPYLFAAHYDVVPVTGQKWNYDPFGGKYCKKVFLIFNFS